MISVRRNAFTLIELLVVVAIIAILAAIAVPNFLEAQIRAKVTRAKSDMRVIATALESYHVDNNHYPETYVTPRWERFFPLTTPIAYISAVPEDPFQLAVDDGNVIDWGPRHGGYKMGATPIDAPSRFAISGNGPDRDEDSVPIKLYPGFSWAVFTGQDPDYDYMIYDPTNGTVSSGDVWRCSDAQIP
ncbi:MAG: type II secretion system protein GspG [Candidatus Sumerlaeaceae bacterium]|nr:type II secretion system protein GspG [Candidatus Sumerlaeaceae bacterium]